jgi:hypothetical protein
MKLDADPIPIPPPCEKKDSIVGQMRRLHKGQSFTVPNKSQWTRSGLYIMARRAKIKIATRITPLNEIRVWRTDGEDLPQEERRTVKPDGRFESTMFPPEVDKSTGEVEMSQKEKIEALKDLANLATSGIPANEIYAEPVSELPIADPMWVDAGEHWNEIQGEMVAMERHIKTGKFREKV